MLKNASTAFIGEFWKLEAILHDELRYKFLAETGI